MPRVDPRYIESSLYLYRSPEDARAGTGGGGSGFIVGVIDAAQGSVHRYAVTAGHVIEQGATVARARDRDGSAIVVPPLDWLLHPDGHDIAVASLGTVPVLDGVTPSWVPVEALVSQADLDGSGQRGWPWSTGPIVHGEETFSVARFLNFDGLERNEPVVRFGCLATPEPLLVRQTERPSAVRNQETFLVEARSLSGASGAPVFVYRVGTYYDGGSPPVDDALLLGVAWGHLKHPDDERHEYEVEMATPGMPMPGRYNSGVMVVVPAWRLRELLLDES